MCLNVFKCDTICTTYLTITNVQVSQIIKRSGHRIPLFTKLKATPETAMLYIIIKRNRKEKRIFIILSVLRNKHDYQERNNKCATISYQTCPWQCLSKSILAPNPSRGCGKQSKQMSFNYLLQSISM